MPWSCGNAPRVAWRRKPEGNVRTSRRRPCRIKRSAERTPFSRQPERIWKLGGACSGNANVPTSGFGHGAHLKARTGLPPKDARSASLATLWRFSMPGIAVGELLQVVPRYCSEARAVGPESAPPSSPIPALGRHFSLREPTAASTLREAGNLELGSVKAMNVAPVDAGY